MSAKEPIALFSASFSAAPEKIRASSDTFMKSAYWPAAVRSQEYSNWRVRHSSTSRDPFPGTSVSARAAIGLGSKIGNASNAKAVKRVVAAPMARRACAGAGRLLKDARPPWINRRRSICMPGSAFNGQREET
jgi:hypothetical protein